MPLSSGSNGPVTAFPLLIAVTVKGAPASLLSPPTRPHRRPSSLDAARQAILALLQLLVVLALQELALPLLDDRDQLPQQGVTLVCQEDAVRTIVSAHWAFSDQPALLQSLLTVCTLCAGRASIVSTRYCQPTFRRRQTEFAR